MFKIVLLTCVVASAFGSTLEPIALRKLRLSPLFPDGRIVGGKEIDIREVPYLVGLEYDGRQICGGALITENHVLTSADCFSWTQATAFSARFGTSTSEKGGTVIRVKKGYLLPRYYNEPTDYDAGIFLLSEKAPLSDTVKIIQVSDVEAHENLTLKMAGYGDKEERHSVHLRSVDIPVISRSKCKEMYAGKAEITDRMICTYSLGKDSCSVDRGGPVVANGKVYGIMSWQIGCGRPRCPGVHTNVAEEDVRHFIRVIAKV